MNTSGDIGYMTRFGYVDPNAGANGVGIQTVVYDNVNDQFVFTMTDNTAQSVSFPGTQNIDFPGGITIDQTNEPHKFSIKSNSGTYIFNVNTSTGAITTENNTTDDGSGNAVISGTLNGHSLASLGYLDATSSIQTQITNVRTTANNALPISGGTLTGFLGGDSMTMTDTGGGINLNSVTGGGGINLSDSSGGGVTLTTTGAGNVMFLNSSGMCEIQAASLYVTDGTPTSLHGNITIATGATLSMIGANNTARFNIANNTSQTVFNVSTTANSVTTFKNTLDDGSGNISVLGTTALHGNTTIAGTLGVTGSLNLGSGVNYNYLQMGGGNASGYIYANYANWGDGIDIGYNFYADGSGTTQIPNTGGGTSAIQCGYSSINLKVGATNTAPTSVLSITSAGIVPATNNAISSGTSSNQWKGVYTNGIFNSSGDINIISNGGSTFQFAGAIFQPQSNSSCQIGGSSNRFYSTYGVNADYSGSITCPTFAASTGMTFSMSSGNYIWEVASAPILTVNTSGCTLPNGLTVSGGGASITGNFSTSTNGSIGGILTVHGAVVPNATNSYSCGASGQVWTAVYATNTTIQTSDVNKKKNIKAEHLGLDFINEIKPVTWEWKETNGAKENEGIHRGIIAQDMDDLLKKHQAHDSATVQKWTNESNDIEYGFRYGDLIAPMIKAIQELSAEVKDLKEQINNLING